MSKAHLELVIFAHSTLKKCSTFIKDFLCTELLTSPQDFQNLNLCLAIFSPFDYDCLHCVPWYSCLFYSSPD